MLWLHEGRSRGLKCVRQVLQEQLECESSETSGLLGLRVLEWPESAGAARAVRMTSGADVMADITTGIDCGVGAAEYGPKMVGDAEMADNCASKG